MFFLLWVACAGEMPASLPVADASPTWVEVVPAASTELPATRGLRPFRSILHLHSPWSHDACDGAGLVDGVVDEVCLEDLRHGLCASGIEVAWLTDHPSHAAAQAWEELLLVRDGDSPLYEGDILRANRVPCGDGRSVLWLPGSEDMLMPVGLDAHLAETVEENDRLYNSADQEAFDAMLGAGGVILQAHTEGQSIEELRQRMAMGLGGVEIFNTHAMFAPDKREEDLGLDPFGWVEDLAVFTEPSATAVPDLLFLAVLAEQAPSLAAWDTLLAEGPMVGVGGSDSHQNVMPLILSDGERVDSYRRSFRWFTNFILSKSESADALEAALASGRVVVVFEILGTPDAVDFHLVGDSGDIYEMGSSTEELGSLVVGCPELADSSAAGEDAPEVSATVYLDGEPWRDACGTFELEQAGVYRVRYDILPWHLRPFLGDDPAPWLHAWPWIYTNPIRILPQ